MSEKLVRQQKLWKR